MAISSDTLAQTTAQRVKALLQRAAQTVGIAAQRLADAATARLALASSQASAQAADARANQTTVLRARLAQDATQNAELLAQRSSASIIGASGKTTLQRADSLSQVGAALAKGLPQGASNAATTRSRSALGQTRTQRANAGRQLLALVLAVTVQNASQTLDLSSPLLAASIIRATAQLLLKLADSKPQVGHTLVHSLVQLAGHIAAALSVSALRQLQT